MSTELSREELKAESLNRMRLLELNPELIKEFEATETVLTCAFPNGTLTRTDLDVMTMIRALEEQFGFMVYLNVHSDTYFGEIDNLFFTSKYNEEWEFDHEDLKDGYALVYCINWTYPECSEMGSISFRKAKSGGLVRCGV